MDLLNKLPKNYQELPWRKYVTLINSIPSTRPDAIDDVSWSKLVNLTTLSILLDVPIAAFDAMRAAEIVPLIQGIAFLNDPITEAKTRFKIKPYDQLTYDEFTSYQTLKVDQWNNLEAILKTMVIGMTQEQINDLSIYDVQQIFFLSSRYQKKYLRYLVASLKLKAATRATREICRTLVKRLASPFRKKSLLKNGDGLTLLTK